MRAVALLIPFFATIACAQQPPALVPVSWTTTVTAEANGTIQLEAVAAIQEGWHVYALTLPRNDGPLPTVFTFTSSPAYALKGEMKEPEPAEVEDPNFAMLVRYHSNTPSFRQPIKRTSHEAFRVKGTVEYMACNDRMCLPPTTAPLVFNVEAVTR